MVTNAEIKLSFQEKYTKRWSSGENIMFQDDYSWCRNLYKQNFNEETIEMKCILCEDWVLRNKVMDKRKVKCFNCKYVRNPKK